MDVRSGMVWLCVSVVGIGCNSAGGTASAAGAAGQGGSGEGGSAPCPPGLELCGSACIDTSHHPEHCGGCDVACAEGEVCSEGACDVVCGGDLVECDQACVDLSADPSNCGACGTACTDQQACDGGACLEIVCMPGDQEWCYTGAPETLQGACSTGFRTCNAKGTGRGPCEGEVLPKPEQCGDLVDDDCDGELNNGCVYETCAGLPAGSPSGVYTLDPDGAGPSTPFPAYCEMTIDGGGWTLVASVADNEYFKYLNGTRCWTDCGAYTAVTCDETPFASASPYGDIDERLTSDYKSKAYSSVPFQEFLFTDSNGNFATYVVSAVTVPSVYDWYPVGLQNYVPEGVKTHPTYSYPAAKTNMDDSFNPCGTLQVSFNVEDSDSPINGACHDTIKGPSWSNTDNNGCYWDDAGVAWTYSAFSSANTTTYRLWLVR